MIDIYSLYKKDNDYKCIQGKISKTDECFFESPHPV